MPFFEPVGEVELDNRRRISLARLVNVKPGQRYSVAEGPDGVIQLTPMFSVSARELAVLRNPETMVRINEGLDQAARGDVVPFDPEAKLIELEEKMRGEVDDKL